MPTIVTAPIRDLKFCAPGYYFTFQTDFNTATHGTFDPTIIYTGTGTPLWLFENGQGLVGASISTNGALQGLNGTVQTVTLIVDQPEGVTGIDFNADRIYGTFRIPSEFLNVTSVRLDGNPTLTTIVPAGNTVAWSQFWAYSSGLSGNLNLSSLQQLGGDIRLYSNAALTSITLPSASTIDVTNFQAYSCGLTGTLNVSGLTRLGGVFHVYSNSGLTGITFPSASPNLFTSIRANNCNLSSINISSLVTSTATAITFAANTQMTIFTRASTISVNSLGLNSCRLSTFSFTGITFGGTSPFFQINSQTSNSLTSVTGTVTGTMNLFRIDANPALTSPTALDMSAVNWTGSNPYFNMEATGFQTVNHGTTTGTIRTYIFGQSAQNTYWSLGSLNLSTSGLTFTFIGASGMSTGNVNNWFMQLDSKLGSGTGSIRADGSTPAATGAGITAANSLLSKGYTVIRS